jgi:hypothetical protein
MWRFLVQKYIFSATFAIADVIFPVIFNLSFKYRLWIMGCNTITNLQPTIQGRARRGTGPPSGNRLQKCLLPLVFGFSAAMEISLDKRELTVNLSESIFDEAGQSHAVAHPEQMKGFFLRLFLRRFLLVLYHGNMT